MEASRKDILVKGRFNTWDAKDWAFLILSLVLIGSGLFFLSSPDLIDICYYPLIGSIPFVLIVLIRILFLGNYHITSQAIFWKTLIGPQRSYLFTDIGYCGFEKKNTAPVLLLSNTQGKKIRRFKECNPVEAAGSIVLYFRYYNVLPEIVFNLWKPLVKGKRIYEDVARTIRLDGNIIQEEKGFIVLYENKLLYIPTQAEKVLKDPVIQRLQRAEVLTGKITYEPDKNILTHTLIEALLEANLPLAIRDVYMNQIVSENGGCLLVNPERNGKTWQWFNEGVELKIQRP